MGHASNSSTQESKVGRVLRIQGQSEPHPESQAIVDYRVEKEEGKRREQRMEGGKGVGVGSRSSERPHCPHCCSSLGCFQTLCYTTSASISFFFSTQFSLLFYYFTIYFKNCHYSCLDSSESPGIKKHLDTHKRQFEISTVLNHHYQMAITFK